MQRWGPTQTPAARHRAPGSHKLPVLPQKLSAIKQACKIFARGAQWSAGVVPPTHGQKRAPSNPRATSSEPCHPAPNSEPCATYPARGLSSEELVLRTIPVFLSNKNDAAPGPTQSRGPTHGAGANQERRVRHRAPGPDTDRRGPTQTAELLNKELQFEKSIYCFNPKVISLCSAGPGHKAPRPVNCRSSQQRLF